MRVLWGALLVAMLCVGQARAQAVSQTFDQWSVVCDDVGACATWASAGGWASPRYLLLRKSAAGLWSAHFGVMGQRSDSPGAFEVGLAGSEGRPLWTRRFEGKSNDRAMRDAEIVSAPDVAMLRKALALSRTATIIADGRDEPWAAISLSGADQAIAWVEAWKPTSPPAVIRRAPAASQARLPTARVKTVADCEAPSLHRLSPGKILVVSQCLDDGHSAGAGSDIGLVDERGRDLPGPVMEGYPEALAAVLVNVLYEPATRELSAFQPGEYRLGSCGTDIRWVWDGARFRIARMRRMEDCINVPRALWPSSRDARVTDR